MLRIYENDHIVIKGLKGWLNINIAITKAVVKAVVWMVTLQWLLH